jgi:hypothetical protein
MNMAEENTPNPISMFRKIRNSVVEWFNRKDATKWVEDVKVSISLAASIIATMTFALATNPPGGVVQASLADVGNHYCNETTTAGNITKLCVGQALLASIPHYKHDYIAFLAFDTICFFASITIIFLLVSGIPMDNKATVSILSLMIILALTSLAFTFIMAAKLITPDALWNSYRNVLFIAPALWTVILIIVYIFQLLVL